MGKRWWIRGGGRGGVLVAESELGGVDAVKLMIDVVGHYSRPD